MDNNNQLTRFGIITVRKVISGYQVSKTQQFGLVTLRIIYSTHQQHIKGKNLLEDFKNSFILQKASSLTNPPNCSFRHYKKSYFLSLCIVESCLFVAWYCQTFKKCFLLHLIVDGIPFVLCLSRPLQALEYKLISESKLPTWRLLIQRPSGKDGCQRKMGHSLSLWGPPTPFPPF